MGGWTRVLVDVEDYRGRRERQLREIAERAARRVVETGKMLQLEPMPALERRWVHLALRDHAGRRDPVDRRGAESPDRGPASTLLIDRQSTDTCLTRTIGSDAIATRTRHDVHVAGVIPSPDAAPGEGEPMPLLG